MSHWKGVEVKSATRPITPDEIPAMKLLIIPHFVVEAVNHLLTIKACGNQPICLYQDEILEEAMCRANVDRTPDNEGLIVPQHFFARGWLNIEDLYREAGWNVTYDKPGFNESYKASFTFKRAT